MKKTTVKDEEGFLGPCIPLRPIYLLTCTNFGAVTREEPTWESFSEDEPAPKKKPAVNVPKGKAGKAQGQGQGNIMSFFGKK
jgi:DNA polymerase delta subunit 3